MTYDATTPNETHDPSLRSWIASANEPGTDFPIQNLPFGVFRSEELEADRVGVAIGDQIVDVWASREAGAFEGLGSDADEAARACAGPTLNALMGMEPQFWSALRRALQRLLRDDADEAAPRALGARSPGLGGDGAAGRSATTPISTAPSTTRPMSARMFRPDNPLMPNYKHLPVGYHGRALVGAASGTPVRRPSGQKRPARTTPSRPSGPAPARLRDGDGLLRRPGQRAGRATDSTAAKIASSASAW